MESPQPQQNRFSGFLAEIVEINRKKRTGIYGEIYFVSCRILEGRDKDRVIRRTMVGPARVGDVIRLPDTNREAKEIRVK